LTGDRNSSEDPFSEVLGIISSAIAKSLAEKRAHNPNVTTHMASPKKKPSSRDRGKFKDLESRQNPKGGGMTIALLAPSGTTQGQVKGETTKTSQSSKLTLTTGGSLEALNKNLESLI
jgi:hypothetical protein